jgi:Dolichyl-phosphate-mannose-protein mannosyltransferase
MIPVDLLANIVGFVLLALSAKLLADIFGARGLVERLLTAYIFLISSIVLIAYILSLTNELTGLWAWSIASAAICCLCFSFVFRSARPSRFFQKSFCLQGRIDSTRMLKHIRQCSRADQLILFITLPTAIALAAYSFVFVCITAPGNWDSMTYHLARMAYFRQQGHLDHFAANYWAQVTHPRLSAILTLYAFNLFNETDNFTQLIQYAAYIFSAVSLFGISRLIGASIAHSLLIASLSCLLIEWLMQSTTTQNDMIITSFVGATVYYLLKFSKSGESKYLAVSAIPVSLALATKASFLLVLPSLAVVGFYAVVRSNSASKWRAVACCIISLVICVALISAPSGYIKNYLEYGDPVGPKSVRELHSFEGRSLTYRLRNGSKNMLRYTLDFLSLDGLPPAPSVMILQGELRKPLKKVSELVAVDLEGEEAIIAGFFLDKRPQSHEDFSYWGITGFAFALPLCLLSIVRFRRCPTAAVFGLSFVLFFMAQAFAGPYDPWRGRYFAAGAIFALPSLIPYLRIRGVIWKSYIVFVVLIAAISAVSAVLVRKNSYAFTFTYKEASFRSVFSMDRIQQLTRNRPEFNQIIRRFEQIVPHGAVVAVSVQGDTYEYPFFGEKLTRTLVPINDFEKGLREIPEAATFLVYDRSYRCAQPSDIELSPTLYLRRLTESNRGCN